MATKHRTIEPDNEFQVTDSAQKVLWQGDADWYLPSTDRARFRATIDDLWREAVKELKMQRLAESIAAFLIRRLTSVVRLATRLIGLIPAAESRRDDGE